VDWSKLHNKKPHSFYFQLKMWRLKEGRYAGNVTQSLVEYKSHVQVAVIGGEMVIKYRGAQILQKI